MCKLYFLKEFLLCFTILQSVDALRSENNSYKHSNSSNPRDVILRDMYAAFSAVMTTNGSAANSIENVITHMYNFKFHKNLNAKSAMMFKLPMDDNRYQKLPERTLLIDRQQFMRPTFPNLTKSYMTLRRHKLSKGVFSANISQLMANEMHSIYSEPFAEDDSDWSHLGLNGWHGAIAGSTRTTPDQSEHNKLSAISVGDYPLHEINKDLTEAGLRSTYLQEIKANALMHKNDRTAMTSELDNNIFIARANDPFGYSTKWQMKTLNQTKPKRDVLNLYSMIKCSTGCEPLVYKGYGCYCGFLGHGVPADGIDRCCKLHDKCYEHSNCIPYLEYFVPYVWKCYRGKPLCAIDHGEFGGPDSCAARLCHCDLRLSRCLRQHACPDRRAVCRSSLARRLQNILLT